MYEFQGLPQLVDKRGQLASNGSYTNYGVGSKRVRVWHHSLTAKHLGGSDAESFAEFHVNDLGWPGIGYHFIIEPKNVVTGPDGKERARIVWCHDPGVMSYHVGNSNKSALGICVAGDYRTDELDEPTLRSISELHHALVADGIGSDDKGHNEMPGYSWKECPVYDYKKAIAFSGGYSGGSGQPQESSGSGESYVVRVTGGPLNVRTGPGTNYSKVIEGGEVKQLATGTEWEAFGETNGWHNVGGHQWISGDFVQVVRGNAPTPAQNYVIEVTGGPLNVRTGPGAGYSKVIEDGEVKQLAVGTTWQAYGETNGWHNVGGNQWVSGDFVKRV
ncbi:TPA: N-acetylmuramoyl-L-alanine amidase [Bacillus pacificus]|nr:N-acetylmuramoyl-L-alanine amidase [Bacillus pacificus]HDR7653589.1 N-acetylmuramoyl-L-alanine amidase [Bacillus pacificus]